MAATTGTEGIQLDPKYDDYDFPIVAPVKINGHPGHLTPEQNAAVKQLRESLEKQGYTDRLDSLTLVCLCLIPSLTRLYGDEAKLTFVVRLQLRFLRARKFDLAATEKM